MTSYDSRTIGRWPSRTPQNASDFGPPAADTPLFMFFDGKSFAPVGSRGADFYTGAGFTGLMARPTRLQDNDFDYARAYALCEYAFRCVEMVSTDVARIKHGVRDKNTQTDLPDHPLMRALKWARLHKLQDIIDLWVKSNYVWGETYLLPVANGFRDSSGRPIYSGLQWLNPMVTEPSIYNGELTGYEYSANSLRTFGPRDIIFDKFTSLFDDLRGQSRLSVALQAVNIDIEIKRYTLESFLKNMKMAGILTARAGSGITESELNTVVAMLKQQRDQRLIALNASMEYQSVEHGFNETQFAASEDARRRITTAIGLPMSVIGAWDDAKYQSAPAQIKFYYDNVVFLIDDRMGQVMNDVVLPYFDPSGAVEWYSDRTALSSLVEDRAAKTAEYNARLTSGGITLNEYRRALGDQPIENGDVFYIPSGIIITPASQLAAPIAPQVTQNAPEAALAAINAQPEPAAHYDGASACLMLKFGPSPDLISLQQRVTRLCADQQIPVASWNSPEDFHLTLAYAPVVNAAQLPAIVEALDDLTWPADLTLKVGRLQAFDNVGEFPIVFRVSKTSDLAELQESAYELFTAVGLSVSGHSDPARFKPHVTMGYAAASIGKPIMYRGDTRLRPVALELWHGDEKVYSRDFSAEADGRAEPSLVVEDSTDDDEAHAASKDYVTLALRELSAWKRKVKNVGPYKAEAFKTYLVREEVATFVIEALSTDDDAIIADAFKAARDAVSLKAIQATRIQFEDAFEDLLTAALAGDITRRQWSGRLRSLLELNIYRAFLDGLRDGGVDDPPEAEEQEQINALIAEQGQYIKGLADTIFKDEDTVLSEAVASQKPAMWFNKSVNPAYQAGIAAADGNGLYEWVYGDTEHCSDCRKLNGQRHRMKDYTRKGLLPKSSDLECKGFYCECNLVKSAGKARGTWI